VVHGLLCPSLWTRDSQVVPDRNAPITSALVMLDNMLYSLEKRQMYLRRVSPGFYRQFLRSHGFRESLEQSCCGSDVLTCPDKELGSLVVFEDPPVYIMGVGACTPTASVTSDLVLEFGMFLL
jgi:hypothetical protein